MRRGHHGEGCCAPQVGAVRWLCSEEGGGPDVGKSIILADGTELYFGEISRRAWEDAGGSEISPADTGWWIVHWRHDGPNLLGRALPYDAGQIETLAAAIATEAGTAETTEIGSVHESAGRKASPETYRPSGEQ